MPKTATTRRRPRTKTELVPHWDKATWTWTFDGNVLKRFTRFAEHQMALLSYLEDHGWPECSEDVLEAFSNGGNRKRALHAAIQRLNRVQEGIRLHGFGSGTGVRWEVTKSKIDRIQIGTRLEPGRWLTRKGSCA